MKHNEALPIVADFLKTLSEVSPMYAKRSIQSFKMDESLFCEMGGPMLSWARAALGESYPGDLIEGYQYFLKEVNSAQYEYEKIGHYKFSNYAEVAAQTYQSPEFMQYYHWGVFVANFAWEHHLQLYKFFRDNFLALLNPSEPGLLVDLGCGSGLWSLLALSWLHGWHGQAVDISPTSIALASAMASSSDEGRRLTFIQDDALTFTPDQAADAALSCFLLEHLETPEALLKNMARTLKPGGLAFLTAAISAAEIDHIHEFKWESEVLALAEAAGFRLLALHSFEPDPLAPSRRFTPRSVALLLRRLRKTYW